MQAMAAAHASEPGSVCGTASLGEDAKVARSLFHALVSGASVVELAHRSSGELIVATEQSAVELNQVVAQLTEITEAFEQLQRESRAIRRSRSATSRARGASDGPPVGGGEAAAISDRAPASDELVVVNMEDMSAKVQANMTTIERLLGRLPREGASDARHGSNLIDAVGRLEAEASRLRISIREEAELAAANPPADFTALREVLEEQHRAYAALIERIEQGKDRSKQRIALASVNARKARDRARQQLQRLRSPVATAASGDKHAVSATTVSTATVQHPVVAFEGRTAVVPIDVLKLVVFMTLAQATTSLVPNKADEEAPLAADACLLGGIPLHELVAAAIIAETCRSTDFADFADAQTTVLGALASLEDSSHPHIKLLSELLQQANITTSQSAMLCTYACDCPGPRNFLRLLSPGTQSGRSGLPQAITSWASALVNGREDGVSPADAAAASHGVTAIPANASRELCLAAEAAKMAEHEAAATEKALAEAVAALEQRKVLLRTLHSQVPEGFMDKVHAESRFWAAMAEDGVRRLEAELDLAELRSAAESAAARATAAAVQFESTHQAELAGREARSAIRVTFSDFTELLDATAGLELSRVGIRFRPEDLDASMEQKDIAFTSDADVAIPCSSAQVSTAFVAARAFQRILCTDIIEQAPATFNYLLGFDLQIKRSLLADDIDQVFGCLVALAPSSVALSQRAELPLVPESRVIVPASDAASPAASADTEIDDVDAGAHGQEASAPVPRTGDSDTKETARALRICEREVVLPAVDFQSLVKTRPEIALAVWWGLGLGLQPERKETASSMGLAEFRRVSHAASRPAQLAALVLLREVFVPAHDRIESADAIASRFEGLVRSKVLAPGIAHAGREVPSWRPPPLEKPTTPNVSDEAAPSGLDEDPSAIMDRLSKESSFTEDVEFLGGGCVPA